MMKGYLTVFLSLSLSVLAGFVLFLIGHTIQNAGKIRLEGDVDIGMNSVLAEFSIPLHDRYDLLYIDASYLDKTPSVSNMEDRLSFYIRANSESDLQQRPWGDIRLKSIAISGLHTAAEGMGNSMKYQAVQFMEDSGIIRPETELFGDPGRITALERDNAFGEWSALQEQIAGMELPTIQNEAGEWEEVALGNPADRIFGFLGSDVLFLLGVDGEGLGAGRIQDGYISERKPENMRGIPWKKADDGLFLAYLFEKMGNYGREREGSFLKLQLEYIAQGQKSDYENLAGVAGKLVAWRFAANAKKIFGDGGMYGEASAAAMALRAVQLDMAFHQPVTRSILYACAYLEALADVKCLLEGGRIEIEKQGWSTGIESVLEGAIPGAAPSEQGGLGYEQYLACMLRLLAEGTRNLRSMDIMEMDIRYLSGNPRFAMDWCVEKYTAEITALGGWNNVYSLKRTYGYY